MSLKIPEDVIKKYEIKLLVVFGSYNTSFENENSDLDIGFLTEKMLSYDEEATLLDDLIQTYRRADIDLVNLRKATPGLKLEVAREGRVIFEIEGEFEKFQLYAARIYADTRFLRKKREEVLNERIANSGPQN